MSFPADSTSTGTMNAPDRTRRARPTGLTVAAVGIVLFNISPFLNWVDPQGDPNARTGYETDSLVPFIAYLGVGLLVALVYAMQRARRGQHRGLTLVSMAVGIAATLQGIAFAVNPMGGLERGDDLDPQIGVYVAILGAAIWAIGSGLLAQDIEGDDRDDTYGDAIRTR
jgi:peptidoglycan/LPS O-acetylase OafA/YrhL